MHLHECVCRFMCVYGCLCTCGYVSECMYIYIYIYIYMYVCVCVCVCKTIDEIEFVFLMYFLKNVLSLFI